MNPRAPRRERWSTRAFRSLLALYPSEFRDEYGRELALLFADRHRDSTSPWQRLTVWIEAIAGLLREAPKEHMHMVAHDLRFAARAVTRSPGFAATVILTLALGIGANAAIFQLISAIHFRTLPVLNPNELAEIRIAGGNPGFGVTPNHYGQLTRPVWEEIRANQQAFSGVFAWGTRTVGVGELPSLRLANGLEVSGELFSVLGVQAAQGRLLDASDEQTTCPSSTAVASYRFWQLEMGGRPIDATSRLLINGDWHHIVGVTPPAFSGLIVGDTFDLALPLCRPAEIPRHVFDLTVMGRLRPGWTIERASAHVDSISAGIFDATTPSGYSAQSTARFKAFRLAAYSAAAGVSDLRDRYDTPLRLLFGITTLVLLIACANLANLFLARAIAREREVSIRLALGGSRVRLLRQFLAESTVLAAIGTAVGVVVAQFLSRGLVWLLSTLERGPGSSPLTLQMAIDWRLFSFAAIVVVGTCLVLGMLPALRATRIAPAMNVGGRALTSDRRRFVAEQTMVVLQMAVSVVLVVAALLFVRSFRNLMTFDAGMRQDGITVARLGFPQMHLPPERVVEFQRELLAEVTAIPGVFAAGTTSNVPLLGSGWGHGIRIADQAHGARFTWVSPGYFDALGIRVVEGRDFNLRDTRSSPRVAVVNQAFVRQFGSAAARIGQTLRTNAEPNYPATEYEIVGIIPDTQYNSLRGERPAMVFAPDTQHPSPGLSSSLMVYSAIEPSILGATISRAILAKHPGLFVDSFDFAATVRRGFVRERLLAVLATFFGGLATLLAMVGVYGMISFVVASRQTEIGVRLALGAQRAQVVAMVMRQVVRLLAIGIPVGAALALLAGRSAGALLFRLAPHDPVAIAGASVLLLGVALAAGILPARRASRLDPLVALRNE